MLIPLAFSSQRPRLDTIISKYPAANAYSIPSRFFSKEDFSNACSSMFQLPSFAKICKYETPAPNHYNVRTLHMLVKCILNKWFAKIKGMGELWEIAV